MDKPVRCFTCGKPLPYKNWREFEPLDDEERKVYLTDNNFVRMCCRRMFLSHPFELSNTLELYDKDNSKDILNETEVIESGEMIDLDDF